MSRVKMQSEYPDLDKYKYEDEEYEDGNGDIIYYKKDTKIWHNPYGPAIIWADGRKYYFINNKKHRLDGPAMMYRNGKGTYYINNEELGDTKQEFYNNIKYLHTETINAQDKLNVLNIKNYLSNGLDNDGVNILKLLL